MMFLDGAIATLAPDLDIFGEIADISMHFAAAHGEHIAAELGLDPDAWQLDMTGVKASFGIDESVESLTYRDLQERRTIIRERLESQRPDRSKKKLRSPFRK
jgi:ubiquinone biosynthesis protein